MSDSPPRVIFFGNRSGATIAPASSACSGATIAPASSACSGATIAPATDDAIKEKKHRHREKMLIVADKKDDMSTDHRHHHHDKKKKKKDKDKPRKKLVMPRSLSSNAFFESEAMHDTGPKIKIKAERDFTKETVHAIAQTVEERDADLANFIKKQAEDSDQGEEDAISSDTDEDAADIETKEDRHFRRKRIVADHKIKNVGQIQRDLQLANAKNEDEEFREGITGRVLKGAVASNGKTTVKAIKKLKERLSLDTQDFESDKTLNVDPTIREDTVALMQQSIAFDLDSAVDGLNDMFDFVVEQGPILRRLAGINADLFKNSEILRMKAYFWTRDWHPYQTFVAQTLDHFYRDFAIPKPSWTPSGTSAFHLSGRSPPSPASSTLPTAVRSRPTV